MLHENNVILSLQC